MRFERVDVPEENSGDPSTLQHQPVSFECAVKTSFLFLSLAGDGSNTRSLAAPSASVKRALNLVQQFAEKGREEGAGVRKPEESRFLLFVCSERGFFSRNRGAFGGLSLCQEDREGGA